MQNGRIYLAHHGIEGQQWHVRRFQNEDGSLTEEGRLRYGVGVYTRNDGSKDYSRMNKDARKDAEDMARAAAYYGEGAGNRRKQVRNRISERMKDPEYKKLYEKYLSEQDMSQHQKAANRERHMNDAKNTVAKTARGIKNLIMGFGSASLVAVSLYNVAKITGYDQKIAQWGKQAINMIRR